MSLIKLLWASACAFIVFLSLWFLRLLHVLGSEIDILVGWISAISLILCGVFIGVFVSEKHIRVRAMLIPFLLFAIGFFAAPFVGVGVLMLFEVFAFSRGAEPVIFGGSVVAYLLLYMGLWFWLKKKGILSLQTMNVA